MSQVTQSYFIAIVSGIILINIGLTLLFIIKLLLILCVGFVACNSAECFYLLWSWGSLGPCCIESWRLQTGGIAFLPSKLHSLCSFLLPTGSGCSSQDCAEQRWAEWAPWEVQTWVGRRPALPVQGQGLSHTAFAGFSWAAYFPSLPKVFLTGGVPP